MPFSRNSVARLRHVDQVGFSYTVILFGIFLSLLPFFGKRYEAFRVQYLEPFRHHYLVSSKGSPRHIPSHAPETGAGVRSSLRRAPILAARSPCWRNARRIRPAFCL